MARLFAGVCARTQRKDRYVIMLKTLVDLIIVIISKPDEDICCPARVLEFRVRCVLELQPPQLNHSHPRRNHRLRLLARSQVPGRPRQTEPAHLSNADLPTRTEHCLSIELDLP